VRLTGAKDSFAWHVWFVIVALASDVKPFAAIERNMPVRFW